MKDTRVTASAFFLSASKCARTHKRKTGKRSLLLFVFVSLSHSRFVVFLEENVSMTMMKCFALPFATIDQRDKRKLIKRFNLLDETHRNSLLVCPLEMRHDKLLDGLVIRKYKGKFQCLIIDRDRDRDRDERMNETFASIEH